ncbi:phage terminase small subunit [Streptomyces reniochalinae]
MWKASPQAEHFSSTDWDFLLDTALIHARLWSGEVSAAPELRLRAAKFGATPEDRARLRMQFAQADEADEGKGSSGDSAKSRYGKLRVLKAAGEDAKPGGDPMPWRGPEEPGEMPTLGWLVLDWIIEYLAAPDRADYEPFIPTQEQAEFIVRYYELHPGTGSAGYGAGSCRGRVAGVSLRCWPPLPARKLLARWCLLAGMRMESLSGARGRMCGRRWCRWRRFPRIRRRTRGRRCWRCSVSGR